MYVTDGNIVEPQPRNHGGGRLTYSKYRGVTWHKSKRVWLAYMDLDRKRKHLGSFPATRKGERDAAHWVDEMLTRHGIFTHLNFPLE
jgi:AP2 domain